MEDGVKTRPGWQIQRIIKGTRMVDGLVGTKEPRLELAGGGTRGGGRLDVSRIEVDEIVDLKRDIASVLVVLL
jgi:hypothetical protein